MTMRRLIALAVSIGVCTSSAALEPSDIYAQVAPSIWRVQTYDVDGLPLAIGTGVVIAPDTLVTNCHVLAKAKRVAVKHDKTSVDAKLELWDPQRDVCQISAPGLGSPAVSIGEVGSLKVGQNVYAIGSPRGLDLTMSAGLLSSIRRNEQEQVVLLQTSAPISGGSSGGGLFDDQAMLIGLTTLGSVGNAQNLNFAIPADWIKELPQRHAKLSSKPAATATTAAATAESAVRVATSSSCFGAGKRPPPPLPEDAQFSDASRLPHASEKMRDQYRQFLSCPLPRAFAISDRGRWAYTWSTSPPDTTMPTDPAQRALRYCERSNGAPCFLYAVDNRLVYKP